MLVGSGNYNALRRVTCNLAPRLALVCTSRRYKKKVILSGVYLLICWHRLTNFSVKIVLCFTAPSIISALHGVIGKTTRNSLIHVRFISTTQLFLRSLTRPFFSKNVCCCFNLQKVPKAIRCFLNVWQTPAKFSWRCF